MSDDLDDFLRQAAERRAKRQQQKGASPSSAPPANAGPRTPPASKPQAPSAPPSPPSQPRARPAPSSKPTAPSAKPTSLPQRQGPLVSDRSTDLRSTVGNLEPSLAGRHVESSLELADERMAEHVNDAFGGDLQSSRFPSQQRDSAIAPRASASSTSPTTSTTSKNLVSSQDIKEQLRNPQTLRLAIIAHTVLERPYQ